MKPLACAHELKHLVTVETVTEADDGYGGQTKSWSTRGTMRCKIKQVSAGERFNLQRLENPATHKFIARYDASLAIEEKDRLSFDSREFNVRSIENVEESNLWWVILAEEGVVN